MSRFGRALPISIALVAATSSAAFACGGLIGPRGAVQLLRTTTLAAYHKGVEHYVTSFTFTGAKGNFGSIVPLPGIPTKVQRGGDWTLQRLQREVAPPVPEAFALSATAGDARAAPARVILQTRIDALDITVLEGGAQSVGLWAERNGFELSPDAPEILDFYARRSRIFMAAKFDATAANRRGQQAGDGTPIHLTIPTRNPWVPLHILGLGKAPREAVQLDLFLLTDRAPAMLPAPQGSGAKIELAGMRLERYEAASESLLADLKSDKGMGWVPRTGMWLTYLKVDTPAPTVRYDLSVDASGRGRPSRFWAGLPEAQGPPYRPVIKPEPPQLTALPAAAPRARPAPARSLPAWPVGLAGASVLGAAAGLILRRRLFA